MSSYIDAESKYWAEVFMACRLEGEGVRLEDFLATPEDILHAFGMSDAPEIMAQGFLPLLPRQARVRARLERLEAVNEEMVRLAPKWVGGKYSGQSGALAAA